MAQGRHVDSGTATGAQAIGEDMAFQQREWSIQRLAWIVMALFVAAALLGLGGGGGLATSATGQTPDGALQLRYSSIERAQAPARLELNLVTESHEQVEVWLGNEFLSGIEMTSIRPEPIETRAGADRQIFVFGVADGAGEIQVSFQYQPLGFGLASGNVGLVEGQELSFRQLAVP